MKSKTFIGILVVFSVLLFIFLSCKKEKETESETSYSVYGSSKSHNNGQNCMNCHKQNGSGEGLFIIAGTVYDSLKTFPYPNTTVKLYTGPNETGTLKYTIQVDASGNFYTTENIDFGSGLFPAVLGNNAVEYMYSVVTMGQCNSCHGVTTGKIWTK